MSRSFVTPVSRRRFAWLLWLALLTPLAQAAAAWHVVAHESAQAGSEDGKHGPAHAQCELCLAAAALGSGALPGKPSALACPACTQEAPGADSGTAALAQPATAYRSRAPPSAQH
ncbi:MAG: hypothetical protein M9907_09980 [Burkholderiaceae bacterium]|nr:hypothetical protein [Burkholderiaceae bacterium]